MALALFHRRPRAEALTGKLLMLAERSFRRLDGPRLVKEVYAGTEFVDGVAVKTTRRRLAA